MDSGDVLDLRFNKEIDPNFSHSEVLGKIASKVMMRNSNLPDLNPIRIPIVSDPRNYQPPNNFPSQFNFIRFQDDHSSLIQRPQVVIRPPTCSPQFNNYSVIRSNFQNSSNFAQQQAQSQLHYNLRIVENEQNPLASVEKANYTNLGHQNGPNYQPKNPNFQQTDPNFPQKSSSNFQQNNPRVQQKSSSSNFQQTDPNYPQKSSNVQQNNLRFQQKSSNFQQNRPNFQLTDPNFGHQNGVNQQKSPNFHQNEPNFQQTEPNYPQKSSNIQQNNPPRVQQKISSNFQQNDPRFQHKSSNFQQNSPNFQLTGPNFGHQNGVNQQKSSNFHQTEPNFQPTGQTFQQQNVINQQKSPNFQQTEPNYPQRSSNFHQNGPNFQSNILTVQVDGPNFHSFEYRNEPGNFGQNCQSSPSISEHSLRIVENEDGDSGSETTEFEEDFVQNPSSKSAQIIEETRNFAHFQGLNLKRGPGRPPGSLNEKRPNVDLNDQPHPKEKKKYKMSGGMAYFSSTSQGSNQEKKKRGRPRKIRPNEKTSPAKYKDIESKSIYSDISEDEIIPTKKDRRNLRNLIEELTPRYVPESSSYPIYNGNHTRTGIIVENPSKFQTHSYSDAAQSQSKNPPKIGMNSSEIAAKYAGNSMNNYNQRVVVENSPKTSPSIIGVNLPEMQTNLKSPAESSSNFIYKVVENPHRINPKIVENTSKFSLAGENFSKMCYQNVITLQKIPESHKIVENSSNINQNVVENALLNRKTVENSSTFYTTAESLAKASSKIGENVSNLEQQSVSTSPKTDSIIIEKSSKFTSSVENPTKLTPNTGLNSVEISENSKIVEISSRISPKIIENTSQSHSTAESIAANVSLKIGENVSNLRQQTVYNSSKTDSIIVEKSSKFTSSVENPIKLTTNTGLNSPEISENAKIVENSSNINQKVVENVSLNPKTGENSSKFYTTAASFVKSISKIAENESNLGQKTVSTSLDPIIVEKPSIIISSFENSAKLTQNSGLNSPEISENPKIVEISSRISPKIVENSSNINQKVVENALINPKTGDNTSKFYTTAAESLDNANSKIGENVSNLEQQTESTLSKTDPIIVEKSTSSFENPIKLIPKIGLNSSEISENPIIVEISSRISPNIIENTSQSHLAVENIVKSNSKVGESESNLGQKIVSTSCKTDSIIVEKSSKSTSSLENPTKLIPKTDLNSPEISENPQIVEIASRASPKIIENTSQSHSTVEKIVNSSKVGENESNLGQKTVSNSSKTDSIIVEKSSKSTSPFENPSKLTPKTGSNSLEMSENLKMVKILSRISQEIIENTPQSHSTVENIVKSNPKIDAYKSNFGLKTAVISLTRLDPKIIENLSKRQKIVENQPNEIIVEKEKSENCIKIVESRKIVEKILKLKKKVTNSSEKSSKNAENQSEDSSREIFENPPKLIAEVLENRLKSPGTKIYETPPKLSPMIAQKPRVTLRKTIEKIDKNLETDSTKVAQISPKSPSLLSVNPENTISNENEVSTIKNKSKSSLTYQSFELAQSMPDTDMPIKSSNDQKTKENPKNDKPVFVSTDSVIYRNNELPFKLRVGDFSNNLQIVEAKNMEISSENVESENMEISSENVEPENQKISSEIVESENMEISSENIESHDKSSKEIGNPAQYIEIIEISDSESDSETDSSDSDSSDDEENSEFFNLGSILFQDKEFTDIELSVGDQIFKVHRAVLASQSSFFLEFFKKSKSNSTEVWSLPDAKQDIFKLILNFMYKGEIQILNNDILIDILDLADRFKIKKLVKICKTQLVKVEDFEPEFGIKLLEIGAKYSDSDYFLDTILQLVKPIYKDIKKLPVWKEMVENPTFVKVLQKLVFILDK